MDAVSDDELQAGARFWWVMLVIGLFSVALGIIMILHPYDSVAWLAWLAGLFLVLGGISGFFGAKRREVGIGWAITSLVLGLVLMRFNDESIKVVAVIAGIGYLLRGVFRAVAAFMDRDQYTVPLLVVGAVGIVVGLIMIVDPELSVAVLGLVLGIGALIAGIGEILTSFELKKLAA